MALSRLLRKAESGLPITEAHYLEKAVHWTPSKDLPIHRWFRYREGFSPYLLHYFSSSKSRLDPFCGCGTTLLESAMHRIEAYGLDINPLATFVTRTKTQNYTESDRTLLLHLGNVALKAHPSLEPEKVPDYELLHKIFLPESLKIVQQIKSFINTVEHKKVHDLLLLAWLSILEKSSNVFKEGNGLKYRNKRRMPGKYVTLCDSEWISRHFGESIPSFIHKLWSEKITQMAEDIALCRVPRGYPSRVRTGSCLDKNTMRFRKPIDLAIFSPPYANRFDYFEAFKIELWMGGFVKSSKEMSIFRGKSMRNNLAARKYRLSSTWNDLAPFLDCMDSSASSVRMGIKNALEGYFYDTRVLLRNLKNVLSRKGKVVIVVGNSAYAKSIIPSDILVARIGQEEGYALRDIKIARHLHVSSQQRSALKNLSQYMRESVIIFDKCH
jgi:hypothetical protein